MSLAEISGFAASSAETLNLTRVYYKTTFPRLNQVDQEKVFTEASIKGYTLLFKLLLQLHNEPFTSNKVLMSACAHGSFWIADLFFQDKAKIKYSDTVKNKRECLLLAARGDHLQLVQYLVSMGNLTASSLVNSAKEAALYGNLDTLTFLISSLTEKDTRDVAVFKSFTAASCAGHLLIMTRLMAQYPDVFSTKAVRYHPLLFDHLLPEDAHRTEPLGCAAEIGSEEIVDFLIESIQNKTFLLDPPLAGSWAFQMAAKNGNIGLLKKLLPLAIGSKKVPQTLRNAFVYTAIGGKVDALDYILSLCRSMRVEVWDKVSEAMDRAASHGNLDILEKMQKMFQKNPSRLSFVNAAGGGHIHVLKYLLQFGTIDPSSPSNLPLVNAATNGHLDVVQFLMSKRPVFPIDPSALNNAAFVGAARQGHVDVLKYLIGFPEVHPAAQENAAFVGAAEMGHVQVSVLVSLPKESGIDPSAKENEAFKRAALRGHLDVLEYLVSLNLKNRKQLIDSLLFYLRTQPETSQVCGYLQSLQNTTK